MFDWNVHTSDSKHVLNTQTNWDNQERMLLISVVSDTLRYVNFENICNFEIITYLLIPVLLFCVISMFDIMPVFNVGNAVLVCNLLCAYLHCEGWEAKEVCTLTLTMHIFT